MPYVGWKVFLVLRDIVTNGGFAFWVSFATNVLYNIKRPRKVYVEHDYVSVANMYSFKANWFLNINRYLVNKIFDVGQIFFFCYSRWVKKHGITKFFLHFVLFSIVWAIWNLLHFRIFLVLKWTSWWHNIIFPSLAVGSGNAKTIFYDAQYSWNIYEYI